MRSHVKRFLALLMALMIWGGVLASPVLADGILIIGEVTVTSRYSSNLRSGPGTNFPVAGTARPGQVFESTGLVGDFYQLVMSDGSFLYLHKNLASFASYPNPVPPSGQYTIPVYYRTGSGQSLYTAEVPVSVGQNTITANDALVPGYRLTSTRSVYVSVDARGNAFPSGVVFLYEPSHQVTTAPSLASVPVYYKNIYGQVLNSELRSLSAGTHLVRADSSKVPYGYALSGVTDMVVFVSAAGIANPSSVSFVLIQSSQPTPSPTPAAYATIPIYYRDQQGSTLYSTNQTLGMGYSTITANDGLVPSGYTLEGYRSIAVTVYADGSLSQSRVEFTYRPPAPPVTVNIPVVYQDHTGGQLNQTTVAVSSASPNTVRADNSLVPANYVLTSSSTVTVRVSADGTASPARVVFTYRDRSTIVTIPAIDTYQTIRLQGSHPVYSGPGTHYYLTPRAEVSGGQSRVYGSENGWILMGYGLSGGDYRIGWVNASALPAGTNVSELAFAYQPARAVNLVRVYDDPIVSPSTVFEIQPGGTFTVLATQRDGYYAYIETEYNGQPYRGFVNQRNIQLQ